MELDDHAKKAVRDLGDAINPAVEKSTRVSQAIEHLREIGFEPHLNLRLEIGLQETETGKTEIDRGRFRSRTDRRRRANSAPDEDQILRIGFWFLVFGFWNYLSIIE